MKLINVAVIGCGEQAMDNLLPSLSSIQNADLVATCDLDLSLAKVAAQTFGVPRCYTNYLEMLESESVDAVVLAISPQVHYEIAKHTINEGIHTFIEKPPTVTTEQCRDLAKQAKSCGVVTAVGHNFRFAAQVQQMTQIASEKSFGQRTHLEIKYLASKPKSPLWGLSLQRSFLLAQAIHPLDLLLAHQGRIRESFVKSRQYSNGAIWVQLETDHFQENRTGSLMIGSCASHFQIDIEILSDQSQSVRLDSLWNLSHQTGEKRCVVNRFPSPLDSGHGRSGYLGELQSFTDAILNGEPTAPSLEDEIRVYEVIDVIEKALMTGRNLISVEGAVESI
jgi:phthalate 4,5-cis-dihydrodiol dehydrogenase